MSFFKSFEAPTTGRFFRRVGVLFCLAYLMGWIDRANIGFAKLQMLGDLGLTESAFAFGASMFFIGYVLISIPVAFVLPKAKPALVLASMVGGFGIVTMLQSGVSSAESLSVLRFILGLTEGGLSSALVFYLAGWVPYVDRLRISGMLLATGMASNVFAGALCGTLLDLDGVAGLSGWQWMFLVTGLPSVVLAAAILWRVPDGPQAAPFYAPDEKAGLARALVDEHAGADVESDATFFKVLRDLRLWLTMGILAAAGTFTYGFSYWLPTVIREFGVSNTVNGFLSAFPWLLGIVAMFWVPIWIERSGRAVARLWVCVLLSAGSFAFMPFSATHEASYVLICIGATASMALQPILLVLPTRFLRGRALAYGLPLIGLATNLGAFFAQNIIARLGQAYGPASGLLYIAGAMAVLGVLVTWLYQALAAEPPGGLAAQRP